MIAGRNIKLVYFLGIGGIGMSALARFFNHHKVRIAGYDKTPTELTNNLREEGIEIHFDENTEYLEYLLSEYKKEETLIVFTPAIPKKHKEYIWLEQNNYQLLKRAVVLGEICKNYKTIAVAGTHGKTTTSSMVAHLLINAGKNCIAFLGGITNNYKNNLLLYDNQEKNGEVYLVVEADEYDRSFLTLHPNIAILTSVDPDHLDIFGDEDNMREAYKMFLSQVKNEGKILVNKNVDNVLPEGKTHFSYSVTLKADISAHDVSIKQGLFFYNIHSILGNLSAVTLGIPGLHNVENSLAAASVAKLIGISDLKIIEGLESFRGVKRRFEYHIRKNSRVYIDDYAHHPNELKACIEAARSLFPDKKITGVFQPHLFSRTRDFLNEFAESLEALDEVILLPIYPAREIAIPGITSELLLDKISINHKTVVAKENLVEYLVKSNPEVLLTMGAGDIDTLVKPITEALEIN